MKHHQQNSPLSSQIHPDFKIVDFEYRALQQLKNDRGLFKLSSQILLLIASFALVFFGAKHLIPTFEQLNNPPSSLTANLINIAAYVLMMLFAILLIFLRNPHSSSIVGISFKFNRLLLAFVLGITAAVFFHTLNFIYLYAFQDSVSNPLFTAVFQYDIPLLTRFEQTSPLALIVVFCLLTTLIQEFIFRGMILPDLRARGTQWSSIFWTSLAATLLFFDSTFLPLIFLSNILFSYIRLKNNNILASLLAHLSFNLSYLFLLPLFPYQQKPLPLQAELISREILYYPILFACIAAIILIPLLVLLQQKNQTNFPTSIEPLNFKKIFPFTRSFLLAIALLLLPYLITFFS